MASVILTQHTGSSVQITDLFTLSFLFAFSTPPENKMLEDFHFIRWSEYKLASDPWKYKHKMKASKTIIFCREWVQTSLQICTSLWVIGYLSFFSLGGRTTFWFKLDQQKCPPHLTFFINQMQTTLGGRTVPGYQACIRKSGSLIIIIQVRDNGLLMSQLLGCSFGSYKMPLSEA